MQGLLLLTNPNFSPSSSFLLWPLLVTYPRYFSEGLVDHWDYCGWQLLPHFLLKSSFLYNIPSLPFIKKHYFGFTPSFLMSLYFTVPFSKMERKTSPSFQFIWTTALSVLVTVAESSFFHPLLGCSFHPAFSHSATQHRFLGGPCHLSV